MRWLITNRNTDSANDKFGTDYATLTFWSYEPAPGKDITKLSSWTSISMDQLKAALIQIASTYPSPIGLPVSEQKHMSLFIHGYNNDWNASVTRYDNIAKALFDGPVSLGELILFDWPSKGELLGYLPDRAEARKVADDLTNTLEELYDWMALQQAAAQKDPRDACRARTSIIAHSMGNYVLEYAMNDLWTRKNRPLLVSLMNEVLMVAADVDNDLFRNGEAVSHGDGEGLANMSYRITALYTGRDDVLGASAGLKHFGKRRLGRAGLDDTYPVPDNVWDVDCTNLFKNAVNGIQIHGEYFEPSETEIYKLMECVLKGDDRSLLIANGLVPAALSRVQQVA